MKHNSFVSVAIVALFVAGVTGARVKAEYVGATGSPDAYSANNNNVNVNVAPNVNNSTALALPPPNANPTVVAAQPLYDPYQPAEYGDAAKLALASEMGIRKQTRITPMAGSGDYIGAWRLNTKNNYSLGLVTEFETSPNIGIEVEGGYSNYSLAYTSLAEPALGYMGPMMIAHNFDQFNAGGNAKFYLMRGTFRPYVGGGLQAIYFSGMQQRLPGNAIRVYDYILGAGQMLVGSDLEVSRDVTIGLRGAVLVPLINKPYTQGNGMNSAPGFEENALMTASYYKILGTVSIAL